MKRPTEELLDDLLEEAAPPDFRAALLDKTLRQARRRQSLKRAGMGSGVAVLVAILAAVLWKGLTPAETAGPIAAAPPAVPPGLNIVKTQSLKPAQIVRSGPGSVILAVSDPIASACTIVQTLPSERTYVEINDEQLLNLLRGRQVTLVHRGPNQAELIFSNPEDQKELFVP